MGDTKAMHFKMQHARNSSKIRGDVLKTAKHAAYHPSKTCAGFACSTTGHLEALQYDKTLLYKPLARVTSGTGAVQDAMYCRAAFELGTQYSEQQGTGMLVKIHAAGIQPVERKSLQQGSAI